MPENTATPVKIADIVVSDDGFGTNTLSLAGLHAASFEIVVTGLYLKAGVTLDYETLSSLQVTVQVDDAGARGGAGILRRTSRSPLPTSPAAPLLEPGQTTI